MCTITHENLSFEYTDKREDDIPYYRMTNGDTVWYALVPFDKNYVPATGEEFSLPDQTDEKVWLSTVPNPSKSCDFSGDGKILINDVITFLLLARDNPNDPRVDWNEDGRYAINDAIVLLLDIMNGTCPDASVLLTAESGQESVARMDGLSAEDISYIERMMEQMNLTPEQEAAFHLALYGESGPPTLPKDFSLAQNSPNPFNPATTISYSVPEGAPVKVALKVYDIRGSLVRSLVDEMRDAGNYSVFWDGMDNAGRQVSSGVYLCRMQAGDFMQTKKMVLLK